MTDAAPTSIREPQSVARLSRTFSRSLSAVDLAEPLASLDENQSGALGAELMRARNVSVLGVRRAGLVAGWVGATDLAGGTLGESAHDFRRAEVLDESASLDVVLGALGAAEQVFIEWRGEVAAVITRRDLQKPPLRMWLFGAITVLDANLTWAVGELYPGDSWQSQITPGRFEKAVALRAERQRRGSECALLDCLQVKDKADILMSDARESRCARTPFAARGGPPHPRHREAPQSPRARAGARGRAPRHRRTAGLVHPLHPPRRRRPAHRRVAPRMGAPESSRSASRMTC